MAIDIDQINTKLGQLNSSAAFSGVQEAAGDAIQQLNALNSTRLGSTVDEVLGGIRGLTTNSQFPQIGILTEELEGLQEKIIGDISSENSDLNALVDGFVDGGFLDTVVTLPTPEGINAALRSTIDATDAEIQGVIGEIIPEEFAGQLSDILSFDIPSQFSDAVSRFESAFENLVGSSPHGVLQSVVSSVDARLESDIRAIGITDQEEIDKIIAFLKDNSLNDAVAFASVISDKTEAEIEETLSRLEVTLASQVNNSGLGLLVSSLPAFNSTDQTNKWNGDDTSADSFTLIDSMDELSAEFRQSTREITELVLFGYEIRNGVLIDASNIHTAHIAAGLGGIGFHYVILSDGRLQRGRPIERVGNHVSSHNEYSIALCIPTGSDGVPTVEQSTTLNGFISKFYDRWSGGRLWHAARELDTALFDLDIVIESYRENNGKLNYGSSDRSYSTAELITAGIEGV